MFEFFGHLHPLLVHLPIGILLAALLLQWLSRKEKYKALQPAVSIALLVGALTALFSCITGYILSTVDDYDDTLVSYHMSAAIVLTVVSFLLWVKEINPKFEVPKNLLGIGLFVLIMITGHLGGSLTHGSDYLTKPLASIFSNDSNTTTEIKSIANVQEAQVYTDVIKPIFATKCYSCHGETKQKGGLRMDDSLLLMKGGKDGMIITKNNADESELMKRILLSSENDDHMPPKEKPQLLKEQIALLHWWIDNGAELNKAVKDIPQSPDIKPALLSLQSGETKKEREDYLPENPVEAGDQKAIDELKAQHVLVLPVAQGNNYLMASFITDSVVTKEQLDNLQKLNKQLIWLKLANTNLSDSLMNEINKLNSLTRLDLSNTLITDKGLQQLSSLSNLQYLNLVNTKTTVGGMQALQKNKELTSLFIYKTRIDKTGYTQLKTIYPRTMIDTGGYVVPTLATDTTEVKAKKMY